MNCTSCNGPLPGFNELIFDCRNHHVHLNCLILRRDTDDYNRIIERKYRQIQDRIRFLERRPRGDRRSALELRTLIERKHRLEERFADAINGWAQCKLI